MTQRPTLRTQRAQPRPTAGALGRIAMRGVAGLLLQMLLAAGANAAADSEPGTPQQRLPATHPQTGHGPYLSAGYSMLYSPDDTLAVTPVQGVTTAFLDYDLGFRSSSLAAGYQFKNGWRAELEAGYRRNELELIEFSDSRGLFNTGAKDAVDAFTGFANLYYEFKPNLPVRPYVGVGAGVASVGYKGNFSLLEGFMRREVPLFDARDSAFAWQTIVGASLAFTPRTRLAAEYRFMQTDTLSFSSTDTGVDTTYRTRHQLHMAGIQLQYFPTARRASHNSASPAGHRSTSSTTQGPRRWYVAGQISAVAAEDSDLDDNSLDTNFDAFDLGPGGGLAVGFEWTSRRGWPMRTELEAIHFSNEADLVDFSFIAGEFRLQGDVRSSALAINVIAERNRRVGLRPYAGIGLGYTDVDYDVELVEPRAGFPDQQFLNGSTTSPTAQALLGLRVTLNHRLSASLGYRYWWAPLLKLRNPQGERIKTEHSAHMIQLGLQWHWR